MLAQNDIKKLRSLHQQKFRKEHNQFIAEGTKLITELLISGFIVDSVYYTESWIEQNQLPKENNGVEWLKITSKTMSRISTFKTPPGVLALVNIPAPPTFVAKPGVSLYLDRINDPGNMGAILRTADWFDIKQLICSPGCVERWNPKVVQASMGSLFRIPCVDADLNSVLDSLTTKPTVYAADMEGTPLGKIKPEGDSIVIIGNESTGIDPELKSCIDQFITIPLISSHPDRVCPESLNASIATAIICYELSKEN